MEFHNELEYNFHVLFVKRIFYMTFIKCKEINIQFLMMKPIFSKYFERKEKGY